MRTVKENRKVIDRLRKQLESVQEKQKGTRKQLRAALLKVGKIAGKSVRHIHAMKLKKKS